MAEPGRNCGSPNRRRVLAGLDAGASGLVAGCARLRETIAGSSGGSTDDGSDGEREDDSSETTTEGTDTGGDGGDGTETPTGSADALSGRWVTETTENADATVRRDGLTDAALAFRVHQCNRAVAEADLGELDDTLTVAFDYRTRAEQWWEVPVFEVLVDGEVAYTYKDDPDASIRIDRGTETTGTVETAVDVSGDTTIRFGVRGSDHCSNGDHGDTFFTVTGLTVERGPPRTDSRPASKLETTWETTSSAEGVATVETGSLSGVSNHFLWVRHFTSGQILPTPDRNTVTDRELVVSSWSLMISRPHS